MFHVFLVAADVRAFLADVLKFAVALQGHVEDAEHVLDAMEPLSNDYERCRSILSSKTILHVVYSCQFRLFCKIDAAPAFCCKPLLADSLDFTGHFVSPGGFDYISIVCF